MLEGLEVSEVLFSKTLGVKQFHGRFDSEFFQKKYSIILNKLNKTKAITTLRDIAFVTDGEHGNPKTTPTGYAKYYGARNVLNGIVDDKDVEYITREHHDFLKKTKLKPNDVLIGCVGSVGYAAIMPDNAGEANIVRNVALVRSTDVRLNNHYLLAYFLSNIGLELFRRMQTGNVQPLVSLDYIKSVPVYVAGSKLQESIKDVIEKAKKTLIESQTTYAQAEQLLLQAIGLNNFKPTSKNTNEKKLSESIAQSGRLDAEYYLPKYEEIEKKINSIGECKPLGSVILKIDTGEYAPNYFNRGEKEGLKFYIRSTNIKGGQIENDDSFYVPSRDFVRIAEAGDIVTARVGSVGVFGAVNDEFAGAVYSDNVLCFRLPKELNPDVYVLLFNSEYYFDLIDRLARGSVQQRLNQETLKDLPIPILDNKLQQQISALIQQSFALKKESKALLAKAKLAVEVAIEEGEERGMEILKH